MSISKKTQKASRQPLVRSRNAGTPIKNASAPNSEQDIIDVEVDQAGHVVTNPDTIPRG